MNWKKNKIIRTRVKKTKSNDKESQNNSKLQSRTSRAMLTPYARKKKPVQISKKVKR